MSSSGGTAAGGFAGRAERLAAEVESLGLDLLLVTNPVNVRWLTGFTGTNGVCLAGPGQARFLTDFRYADRIDSLPGWQGEVLGGDWLPGLAAELAGRVGVEDDHLTLRQWRRLDELAGDGVELVPAGDPVPKLRRVKDAGELELIGAAAELADRIYRELIERGFEGRTELEVARFAVARMREEGAEPSFPPIVAAGPNGASPHAEPGERPITVGELLTIDMGAELNGYCSDCTRTFAIGPENALDGLSREIYGITHEAWQAGLDAVRSGAEGAALDRVARDIIAAAGYGAQFGHGLGHGVGVEIHEAPRLGPRSRDVLVTGDVVTVEPGIYVAGWAGVRIEDMVAVGESGISRNFSGLPAGLTFVD